MVHGSQSSSKDDDCSCGRLDVDSSVCDVGMVMVSDDSTEILLTTT